MNPGRGIALKIASTLVFTLMSVCVKLVADTVPPGQIVFSRSFFALIPITAMLLWQGHFFGSLKTNKPWVHASRGAVGIVSMTFSFAALGYLPLPEAMMIGYAAPLMVVVLSALILSETVRVFRWTATLLGFAGIAVILWPRLTLFGSGQAEAGALIGSAFALVGAFASAFAAIFIRSMTKTEPTGTIVFYFALFGSLIALMSAPFGWVLPTPREAVLLVTMGLLGGIAQMMMTAAYRDADAATVASFEYVSILWGASLGYLVFNEALSWNVMAGGAIVIAAGIFIIFRERQLGLERRREREAGRANAP